MKFSVFQVSRKGGRAQNEDRMGYCYTREAALLVVADGMGGHPDGEVAAQCALSTVTALFQKQAQPELTDVASFLTDALLAAHREILRYGVSQHLRDCPRTTLVMAIVQAGQVQWTHCGDSRFYLLRRGALLTRTRDHSLAEQNADRPLATRLAQRINRNVLFTCLGSPVHPIFKVDGPIALQQGDRLMLCSDGLWSAVPEPLILRALSHQAVDAAVPDLVESALRIAGSASDNVTCLAFSWETPDRFDTLDMARTRPSLLAGTHEDLEPAMDDATIERSIEEINAAIRRSMARKH
ncbi:MAG: serine/threonine-protein phosphatase [Rhodoferax sp.]|jgi:serine/threonine protein phosphatase PrpC|uniref:PP2C family protein-serine/threonine phosphatase n=1 Tax=Rhodoferax sp. TaxID=50421 RepID=UPI001B769D17|nr:PP2C family serine/threonine-protein phosphatase [Rhodoferax sp.]MBP8286963.1 serine/threonine-protein phosphatase [Rhodoferax sp.]MBP9148286.1 serine/threonine-protein phosphatase [Rhodoferax sp.]MBP9737265.1 serine/threonine-protein phosphatase [Rhodoferax sp.]